jgi:hypothetical protein
VSGANCVPMKCPKPTQIRQSGMKFVSVLNPDVGTIVMVNRVNNLSVTESDERGPVS